MQRLGLASCGGKKTREKERVCEKNKNKNTREEKNRRYESQKEKG